MPETTNAQQQNQLPPFITAEVAVKSDRPDYVSILDPKADQVLKAKQNQCFYADAAKIAEAVQKLKKLGFSVIAIGKSTLTVMAPPPLFESNFNVKLRLVGNPNQPDSLFIVASQNEQLSTLIAVNSGEFKKILSGILIIQKSENLAVSATPPPKGQNDVPQGYGCVYPAEIPKHLSKDPKSDYQAGVTGHSTEIVLIDSGFYLDHPFFANFRNNIKPVVHPTVKQCIEEEDQKPAEPTKLPFLGEVKKGDPEKLRAIRRILDPKVDPSGHGTMLLANIVTIAPETRIIAYKAAEKPQVDILQAEYKFGSEYPPKLGGRMNAFGATLHFVCGESAVSRSESQPRIISISSTKTSNSDGNTEYEQEYRSRYRTYLTNKFLEVIRNNNIILVGSGNHYNNDIIKPENDSNIYSKIDGVITVGGAWWASDNTDNLTLTASNLAYGYARSNGQLYNIPDICGLCGPRGSKYLILPTAPGEREQGVQGVTNNIPGNDGWAAFPGGTSAATPQVAAVCALILSLPVKLNAEKVKKILRITACPVENGETAQGQSLEAIQAGLVDINLVVKTTTILAGLLASQTDNLSTPDNFDELLREAFDNAKKT